MLIFGYEIVATGYNSPSHFTAHFPNLIPRMKTLAEIHDPVFVPRQDYSAFDRFVISLLRDKRDLPFIYLTLRISFFMIPVGLLLYIPFVDDVIWWMLAGVYFVMNNFVFKGPFGLMLHCTSHRKWFKKAYSAANLYLPWFVGLFFGQTPETYFAHHIGMHHPENNLEEDESTTMFYQRDSVGGFLKYFLDFMFIGLARTAGYFYKRNRSKLFRKLVFGEGFFFAFCIGLSFVNLPATFMVFILPFLISRLIMMLGNWTQHAFIDPEQPENLYKSSITCINVKYNHKCWNDGYHISHHIKPTMHWTEHPNHFRDNLESYIQNEALIFEGIDFLVIFIYLMRQRYDLLARHVVNIGNTWQSEAEIIQMLKKRTTRIPREAFATATA